VVVDNDQYRALVGLKGDKWGWDWDSAVLYSAAKVHDEADGYSTSLFQAAINRTDASAYNPFSGGNPAAPGIGDSTPNSQATIDSFRIKQVRENKTTLALADFKVSKPDLLTYWAGDIGIAAGVEWRRETYSDNRDARQDTSTPYIDRVRNVLVSTSDLMGHSPSPDVKGARNTTSAYLELAVPLVTPDWNIPLIHKVDLQLAGRYEDFSDVGSVAKPKIAGSWDLWDGFKIRGSWSQGFKAPNLEVVNIPSLERVNSYTDYIQCEADVRAGRRANFSTCGTVYSVSVASLRSGNKNLQPEQSTSYNYGAVFEPKFLPEAFGRVTATIDAWHIEQENVIGLLTDDVALNYDYLLRLGGSSNPLVIRKPPTQAQIDAFRGTGLTAVGDVQNVIASFVNLGPLVVEGVDYGLTWSVPAGPGEFNFNANASQLKKYDQSPTVEGAALVAAKAAGTIPTLVATTGLSYGGSQVEVSGHPKWKYSLNAAYVVENWELGYFMQYTGEVFQAGTTTSTPQGVPWKVQQSWSSNAYVQYKFQTGWLDKGSIRVGVRNLFDQDPPFAFGDTGGWLSSLYQPYPRYWYVNFKKSF
jgi:outer membrane receptor protein involved in Fe transport